MSKSGQRGLFFALAGSVSGLLSVFPERLGPRGFEVFRPGLLFGVAVMIVFALLGEAPSFLRGICFVAASVAAYPVAIVAAILIAPAFRGGSSGMGSGSLDIPLPTVFWGGCVGAFIVLFAAFVLFAPVDILRPVFWSMMGGVLAVIGWVISGSGQSQPPQPLKVPWLSPALLLIWQTGVALCSAFVVSPEPNLASPKSAPGRSSAALKIVMGMFFAAIATLLVLLIYRIRLS